MQTSLPSSGSASVCRSSSSRSFARPVQGVGQISKQIATYSRRVSYAPQRSLIRASADQGSGSNSISLLGAGDADFSELTRLAQTLNTSASMIKSMAYKRKGVLQLSSEEVEQSVKTMSETLQVSTEMAQKIIITQPSLLFETAKQAATLKSGIESICYELNAPKAEVLNLILNNQSILSGKQLRLSVADMAHLAMLKEPVGRIID